MDQWPFGLGFSEIRMDQWPLKSVKSFPRDWHWSMDGSSQKFAEMIKVRSVIPARYSTVFLAWLPLQSLAGEKKLFFVQILGGEKLLKFVEKWR